VVGLAIVGFLLLVIIGIQVRFFLRRRAQQNTTWNTLLARIEPLNFADLERIAKAYLEPRGNQLELQPQAMWRLLGGADGLPRLRRNAEVMLDLAMFVQRWNFEDATVVAEIRQSVSKPGWGFRMILSQGSFGHSAFIRYQGNRVS